MGKTTNILDLNNRLTKVEKEKVAQNSYTSLKNKPKINGVTLSGNKSLADIGAAAAAFGSWIPNNGFNPLTECDGFFCYSVNNNLEILQGIPTNYSEYGTIFGCCGANYKLLMYVDVFGRFAVWKTTGNEWLPYYTN